MLPGNLSKKINKLQEGDAALSRSCCLVPQDSPGRYEAALHTDHSTRGDGSQEQATLKLSKNSALSEIFLIRKLCLLEVQWDAALPCSLL